MSKLQFGWAEVSLTHEKKVFLAGQFATRISQYVEKPLVATALAVSTVEDQMVMVSVDLAGFPWNMLEVVRAKLADNTVGLDPEKVFISAIHTHTGPVFSPRYTRCRASVYDGYLDVLKSMLPPHLRYEDSTAVPAGDDVATGEEMFSFLVEQITAAVLEAWANRKPGAFTNAFGRAVVGHCRRACYNDGSAQMWGETSTAVFTELEGGNDSGIELLYIFDEAHKLTGIVANLACPAQCVQHRHFVSPDFWGEAKMLLRRRFGDDLFLLTQCSAAGDQCPIDLVRWVEPESDLNDPNINHKNPIRRKADPSMFDLAGMRLAGRRIANEIIQVFDDGLDEPLSDAVFEHRVRTMQLPLRRVTPTDVAQAKRQITEYLRDCKDVVTLFDYANMQFSLSKLKRAEVQERVNICEAEAHLVRLGSIAFATNPFELFLDYGNQIKARSLAEQTFVVQLCNGNEAYLPTEKAEKGGHYSAEISSGVVGHEGGEQLVRETLKDINGMFRE